MHNEYFILHQPISETRWFRMRDNRSNDSEIPILRLM